MLIKARVQILLAGVVVALGDAGFDSGADVVAGGVVMGVGVGVGALL